MPSIRWVWSVPERSMCVRLVYPSEGWCLAWALRSWRCALRRECVTSSFPFKSSRGAVLLHWTSPLGWAALPQVKGHQDHLIMNWALHSGIGGDLCSFRHCDGAEAAFGKTPAPAPPPPSCMGWPFLWVASASVVYFSCFLALFTGPLIPPAFSSMRSNSSVLSHTLLGLSLGNSSLVRS